MKKFLSLVLALVMTMSLVTVSAGAKDFTDNNKLNYDEAVAVMSDLKVLDGYTDGSFNPQGNLTRQAAAKIICNLILGPTTAAALRADTAPFKDVPVNHDFAGYITYCSQQGIISGYADGEFKPGAPLTGYAFMKMLLGALGYDGTVEGYVGPNWSVSVAKRALGIGLNKGLVETFNGVDVVTREEAALYAFNTLKATMVEYDSKITVGDVVIGVSTAKNVPQAGYKNTIGDKDTLEFAEKYFPKLDVETVDGIYGRPSNKWTNGKKEIGTYATIAPSFVYTEGTEAKDVYKDLGSDVVKYDFTAFVDGFEAKTAVKPAKADSDDYAYTADGAVTEIYVNDDDEEVTVVEINYYLGEVSKVKEDDDGEYINVTALSDKAKLSDKKFYTEGFEEDDLIVFTVDQNDDGKAAIGEVFAPETATGEISRVENNQKDNTTYLRIDGEKYAYSAHNVYDLSEAGTKQHPALKEEYNLYLDPNGFVLGFEPAEETVDEYLYVLDTHTGLRKEATVLLATGEEVDVRIDDIKGAETLKDLRNKICTYSVDDKGIYDLELVEKAETNKADGAVYDAAATSTINGGRAYMDTKGRTVIVDNATAFVDYDGETAYVGYKDVPSFEKAKLAYVQEDQIATVVFVLEGEKYDDGSVLFMLADDHFETLKYDSKYYREYEAYVDGETQTMYVRENAWDGNAASDNELLTGVLYQVKKTVDEEYVTVVTEVADFDSAREVKTVGVDAFWTVKKADETKADNQWDVNAETTFVVVDFEEGGDVDSIYEGKLKHMDDEDYSIRVYVAKNDKQTAELVYIFRMPGAEVADKTVANVTTSAELTDALENDDVKTIYMANGTYMTTAQITSDKKIVGSENTVIRGYKHTYSNGKVGLVVAGGNVTIENVTFDVSGEDSVGIDVWPWNDVKNVEIVDCTFKGMDHGIWLHAGKDVSVEGCDFNETAGNAINVDGEDVVLDVDDCEFSADDTYPDIACGTETIADNVTVTNSNLCRMKWYAPTTGEKIW